MNDENKRLRAMLTEDVGEEAVEDLLPTVQALRRLRAPQSAPSPALMALLTAQLSQRQPRGERLRYALLLLRSQIQAVSREIWAASALVIALGTLLTFTDGRFGGATTLSALAPMVAAMGVALLYDQDARRTLEIEDATQAGARQLLLARLTLVFGFDLALALIGSLILTLAGSPLSLSELVMSWLAPMTFLSGLAFLLSVVLMDAFNAALFSLSLWLFHLVLREIGAQSDLWALLTLPGLSAPETRPLLIGAGVLLAGVAIWLVGAGDKRYARPTV